MVAFHSLLWATLPFLSFITPSLQARAVLHIDDHHAANTKAATAGALMVTPPQPEPITIDGAYLVAFKDSYRYDKGFLARLSDALSIQATLRVDLTGEVFNGVSIQVSHNQADGRQDEEEDIPTRIKTLEEVVAISPMRQHPKPPVIPSRPLPTGVFKRQRLGKNNSLRAHLMAQVDQAHAAGYTGKGQKIAIIDAWASSSTFHLN
ncbi:subtilisin-like serine protease PR1C [Apiospora arundinis]